MAVIGTLGVNVVANTAPFTRGMKGARTQLTGFRAATARIGAGLTRMVGPMLATAAAAVSVGKAISSLRASMDRIDEAAKLTQALGGNVNELFGLQRAADLSGASAAILNKALEQMTKRIGEAGQGLGEAKPALEDLGISFESLKDNTPAENFRIISERFRQLKTTTEKATIANQLFGRAGIKLINTLNLGSDALKRMQSESDRLRGILSTEDVQKVVDAKDAFADMKIAMAGLSDAVLVAMADALKDIAKTASDAAVGIRELTDALPKGSVKAIISSSRGSAFDALAGAGKLKKGEQGTAKTALDTIGLVNAPVRLLTKTWDAYTNAQLKSQRAVGGVAKAIAKQSEAVKESAETGRFLADTMREHEQLMTRSASITKSLRTPFEKYTDSLMELKEMYDTTRISGETFERGVKAAGDSLDAAARSKRGFDSASRGISAAGGAGKGIAALFDSIQAARRGEDAAKRAEVSRDDRRDAILDDIRKKDPVAIEVREFAF